MGNTPKVRRTLHNVTDIWKLIVPATGEVYEGGATNLLQTASKYAAMGMWFRMEPRNHHLTIKGLPVVENINIHH